MELLATKQKRKKFFTIRFHILIRFDALKMICVPEPASCEIR